MGKGTVLVPVALGSSGKNHADPEGVDLPTSHCHRLHKRIAPQVTKTVDPFRVGDVTESPTVGSGHQNRALAHGYSMFTPAGFKDVCYPDFRTPRVQPKIWVKINWIRRGGALGAGVVEQA